MIKVENLHRFYELLIESSSHKTVELPELTLKVSKLCPVKFAIHLINSL